MVQLEKFGGLLDSDLDELGDRAWQLCTALELTVDGPWLRQLVKDSNLTAAKADPWFADDFIHMSPEAQLAHLKVAMARLACGLYRLGPVAGMARLASLQAGPCLLSRLPDVVAGNDDRQRARAIRILHRVKMGLEPMTLFALDVSLRRRSLEAIGREWFRKGIGPLRQTIRRVLSAELGAEAGEAPQAPESAGSHNNSEKARAIRICHLVKAGLDPAGLFALRVCLSRKRPEETAREWLRTGLGPLRQVIRAVLCEELGGEAYTAIEQLLPYWREAAAEDDQDHV